MELWKLENRKQIAFGMAIVFMLLFFTTRPNAKAENGWVNDSSDGYYNIGNDISVKLDILNSDGISIEGSNGNSKSLFYNGQAVTVKLDWKALENVTTSASLTVQLPVNLGTSQVSFESPLIKSETSFSKSDTGVTQEMAKAELKRDGSTIIVNFQASESSPIIKDSSGKMELPHNVLVEPDASSFKGHDMQIKLLGDKSIQGNNNTEIVVTKRIDKIANGIKIDEITVLNPITSTNIFDLTNKEAMFNFKYSAGSYGINNNDVILIKFKDFGDGDNVVKLTPYTYNSIDIEGTVAGGQKVKIGTIDFIDVNSDNQNTYARVKFNSALKGEINVKGYVKILSNIFFDKLTTDDSVIKIEVNGSEKDIPVKGPVDDRTTLIKKEGTSIDNKKSIRWSIIVNEEDLKKELESYDKKFYPVIENVVVNDKLDDNQYIIEDSIHIVKMLSHGGKAGYKSNGMDVETLRDTTDLLLKLGTNGDASLWSGQRGLSVAEFEKYKNTSNVISYQREDGKIKGFSLNLGSINEKKPESGNYISLKPDGSKETLSKDNKPFGYIVYYNTALTGSTGNSTAYLNNVSAKTEKTQYDYVGQTIVNKNSSDAGGEYATLKLLKVDQNNKPIENIKFELVNRYKPEEYKFTATTNASGYLEFVGLGIGNYTLVEKDSSYYEPIEPVSFEIKNENYKALNLVEQAVNNSIKYKEMSFLNNKNEQKTETVNVITNNFMSGQFKINKKDADTKALLSGAEFAVYDKNNKLLEGDAGKLIISKDGTGLSSLLPLGEYYLIETKAPDGYELSTTKLPILLNSPKEIVVFDVLNKAKAAIKIFKYDPNNTFTGDSLLAGTIFNLYNENDDVTVLESIVIGNDGYGTSKKWSYGKYNLVEVYAPNGYVFSNAKIPITISHEFLDGKPEVNIPIPNTLGGYIRVKKYDVDNVFNGVGTSPLKGTRFKIFRDGDDKNEVGTIVINDDGYGMSMERLPYGKYNLVEYYAPSGYLFTDAKIPVEINKTLLDRKDFVEISVANSKNKIPTTTTPPPVGVVTSPPAGVTTSPPAGVTTSPPAGVTTSPPAGVTTSPPAGIKTATPTTPIVTTWAPYTTPPSRRPQNTDEYVTVPPTSTANVLPSSTTIIINPGSKTPVPTNNRITATPVPTPTNTVLGVIEVKPTPKQTAKNTPDNNTTIDEESPLGSVDSNNKPNTDNNNNNNNNNNNSNSNTNTDSSTDNLSEIDEKEPSGNVDTNKTEDLIEDGTPSGKPNPKTNDSFKAYNLILVTLLTGTLVTIRWFLSKQNKKVS